MLDDRDLLRSPTGHSAQAIIPDIDPALFPVLDKVLPAGTLTSNFVDYTARRVAQNLDLLKQVPVRSIPEQPDPHAGGRQRRRFAADVSHGFAHADG